MIRLGHVNPGLNVKEFFYELVGDTGTHYLTVIRSPTKILPIATTVHAVLKSDYVVMPDESQVQPNQIGEDDLI